MVTAGAKNAPAAEAKRYAIPDHVSLLHGASLRRSIAIQYGIKNIKRVDTIPHIDVRPADFLPTAATTGTRDTERALRRALLTG